MADQIEFEGETFQVAETVAAMAFLRFAKLAQSGVKTTSMEGLAAQYDLLEQCIASDDWIRFQDHAAKVKADGDRLLRVAKEAFSIIAARPTGRSADSSDGPRIIEPSSTDDSSSPDTGPDRVIRRFNDQGRPELALMVRKRQESLSA